MRPIIINVVSWGGGLVRPGVVNRVPERLTDNHLVADVAQLAEQGFCKPQVAGSSPIVGSRSLPSGAGG